MSLFETGPVPSRTIPRSDLLFWWRSRDLSLDARTGQVGILTKVSAAGDNAGQIVGRNGSGFAAGYAMPRWRQHLANDLVTRLGLQGSSSLANQAVERYQFPWPLKIMEFSWFLRVWPIYAIAADVGTIKYLATLGGDTLGGGFLGVGRSGVNWVVRRQRSAAFVETIRAETGALVVKPLDLLINHTLTGLTLQTRDSSSPKVITSTTQALAGTYITMSETWATQALYLAPGGINGLVGGEFDLEEVKIARGLKTFDQIDAMT